VVDVPLDRRLAHEERARDLRVRKAARDQREHLDLAHREAVRALLGRLRRRCVRTGGGSEQTLLHGRVEHRLPGRRRLDRARDLAPPGIRGQVATRAGAQCLEDPRSRMPSIP
jgi:hypothetical protein